MSTKQLLLFRSERARGGRTHDSFTVIGFSRKTCSIKTNKCIQGDPECSILNQKKGILMGIFLIINAEKTVLIITLILQIVLFI